MACACRFAFKIPETLPLVAAAPLLCAGITTYSPMKHYGLDKKGQKLAVVGLGGLGHMAVKFGKGKALTALPALETDCLARATAPAGQGTQTGSGIAA